MKFIIKYLIHTSLALYLRLPIHYLYVIFYSIRKDCNYTLLYKNDESLSLSFNLMFHRSRERISSNSSLCTTSRIKKKAYTIPIHRPSSMKFTVKNKKSPLLHCSKSSRSLIITTNFIAFEQRSSSASRRGI